MDEDKIIMNNVLNKQLDFNVFTNYGLRLIAQRLLEPDPKQRYSAMEAFDELNRVKRGINNRVTSNKINESPKKLIKNPIMYEDLNEKKKFARSSFHNRFKGIFKKLILLCLSISSGIFSIKLLANHKFSIHSGKFSNFLILFSQIHNFFNFFI